MVKRCKNGEFINRVGKTDRCEEIHSAKSKSLIKRFKQLAKKSNKDITKSEFNEYEGILYTLDDRRTPVGKFKKHPDRG